MKKTLIVALLIMSIIVLAGGIWYSRRDTLHLTDEELAYIQEHRNEVFYAGYYPTPAEKSFSIKLCEQIEKDTGLKIELYQESWNNSMAMLKKGELPIVMNMCDIDQRRQFTLFTETFKSIPCGIYSSRNSPIQSFNDIHYKKIGVEREVALLEKIQQYFPKLKYELVVFETFNETRQSFMRGEIDGYLSSKSYDRQAKGLYFLPIDSMTESSNHIGVSKDFPILHSILSKEVQYLKNKQWDILVGDIIKFELEKSTIDFTQGEIDYIEEQESVTVGIPEELFIYAYGEPYELKGILPDIIKKISFITGMDFYYIVDKRENLPLRQDVDLYIDSSYSGGYISNPLFVEDIVIIGLPEKKYINEFYELHSDKVGFFGVVNAEELLLDKMPMMKSYTYEDIDSATKGLRQGDFDYLVLPRLFYETTGATKSLSIRGNLQSNLNAFISGDHMLIEIIDKSLSIIDIDKIIRDNIEYSNEKVVVNKPLLVVILMLSGCLIFIFLRTSYRRITYLLYSNNEYSIKNMTYIKKKYRNKDNYILLIQLRNVSEIFFFYGSKVGKRYIEYLLTQVKELLTPKENIGYIGHDTFIILKEETCSIEGFINEVEGIKVVLMNRTLLSYKYNMSYCLHLKSDDFNHCMNEVYLGLKQSILYHRAYHISPSNKNIMLSRLNQKAVLQKAINGQCMNIKTLSIEDAMGVRLGDYMVPQLGEMSQGRLYKMTEEMGLCIQLDKFLLSRAFQSKDQDIKHVFIRVSNESLESKSFYPRLLEVLPPKLYLYIVADVQGYLQAMEQEQNHEQITYVVRDFGANIITDIQLKYYKVKYVMLSDNVLNEMEYSEDLIDFIHNFCKDNGIKQISNNRDYAFGDYYIVEGEEDESLDCGG